jgi:hypothetical protein
MNKKTNAPKQRQRKPESYRISRATVEKVMAALERHRSGPTFDGDEDNNDEVIEAHDALSAELKLQASEDPLKLLRDADDLLARDWPGTEPVRKRIAKVLSAQKS